MKFTEEQAREALRAELTNKGRKTLHMSERTLARQTEILIKKLATEETGLPDFVADVIEILNEYEGDARKKDSDFSKYKELHPEDDAKNNQNQNQEPPNPTENPELKAALERIAALEKLNEDHTKKETLAQKRKDVEAKLKEKGVKDEEWLSNFLSEVNITEDLDVDAKTESWLKLYNKVQAGGGPGPVPANPQGSPATSGYMEAIKQAANIAKQGRQAEIETKND